MHQQSKDGSSFTALGRTGELGRMELRRSEEQFRWIAAPLNLSLTREHTAVEVYIQLRLRPTLSFFDCVRLFPTASDFEFPCKPLLGPSPELMQPQPSLRVVHRSIVWRQHMGGARRGAKMGGFGAERPFRGHFCTGSACLAPYRTPYRKLPSSSKLRSPKYAKTPYFKKRRSILS